MRITKGYWIWGQFDEKTTKKIEQIKQQINETFNGPDFDVHLTISGPFQDLTPEIKKLFKDLAKTIQQTKLETQGYDFKEQYFQAFFIKVKKSRQLLRLKEKIDAVFCLNTTEYFPHISLFYGEEGILKKSMFAETLTDAPKNIILNTLSLVEVNEEIESWKIIQSAKISTGR